ERRKRGGSVHSAREALRRGQVRRRQQWQHEAPGATPSWSTGCWRRARCGGPLLRLFLRLRFVRIVARRTLRHARLVEEAQDAIGRRRPLGEPSLDLVEVELEAILGILGDERVEVAEPF